MAILINKVSEEKKAEIIQAYKNNISMRQIEKDFDVTRTSIAKYLEK